MICLLYVWFFLFAESFLSSDPEKLIGRWKIEKAVATKPEEIFPSSQFVMFMAEKGIQLFMDGKRYGHITPKGDTINPFPYSFKGKELVVHTKGLDLNFTIQFNTPDTLLMTDKDGLVIKYSKVKPARK